MAVTDHEANTSVITLTCNTDVSGYFLYQELHILMMLFKFHSLNILFACKHICRPLVMSSCLAVDLEHLLQCLLAFDCFLSV